ncbi:MAG: exonuclease domain-containing protein [Thiovulaceae bacterium]|nr:exonuclease domain-containing protein [Sulfurimonadaceae bacterium]
MPKYIILDTETTGTEEEDRIIQLGFIVLGKPSEPIEVYNEFCSPDLPIKIRAMEVHGITPEMIAGKPACTQMMAYQKLMQYNSSENYLLIHNAKFDLTMLEKEGFVNKTQVIDTLRCAKHLFADAGAHRLQYFRYALDLYKQEEAEAQKLGIVVKAHDAIGDVLVLKLFMSKLVEEAKKLYGAVDVMKKLVELTNTPVFIKTFSFGKHKGKLLEEVARDDSGYLDWMQRSMDLDEDMKYSIQKVLHG